MCNATGGGIYLKPLNALTLAEVLITLAIVGIVSALTIPALVHTYKKRLIETRLRQTVSTLTELLHRIEADEGQIQTWYYDKSITHYEYAQRDFAQNTLMKYLKNAYLCPSVKKRECDINVYYPDTGASKNKFTALGNNGINKIVLPNGVGFWINFPNYNLITNGWSDRNALSIIVNVDLNISKDKMYNGVDYFQFSLLLTPQNTTYISSVRQGWGYAPYLPWCSMNSIGDADGNIISVPELCANPDKDNHYGYPQSFCSVMIECNNWKIPDDYPIKF